MEIQHSVGSTPEKWSPPTAVPGRSIPVEVKEWIDQGSCVTLATMSPDGVPQLSVMWAKYERQAIVMATVKGRRKHANLQENPTATVLVTPLGSHDHYVEIRGTIAIVEDGGRELIDSLHEHYRGTRPYPWDAPGDTRVVLKLTPDRILRFHG